MEDHSYQELQAANVTYSSFKNDIDLDSAFFYSVPTSFFVIDSRIPRVIRELVIEAEGCSKMNYLTGASACTRKAIYELLSIQKTTGSDYNAKIKDLAAKNPTVDRELFEILDHIKDMTSEKVHEQSWEAWDTKHLHLFLESLKTALHEIYVIPDEKKTRLESVRALREEITKAKCDTRQQQARKGDTQQVNRGDGK